MRLPFVPIFTRPRISMHPHVTQNHAQRVFEMRARFRINRLAGRAQDLLYNGRYCFWPVFIMRLVFRNVIAKTSQHAMIPHCALKIMTRTRKALLLRRNFTSALSGITLCLLLLDCDLFHFKTLRIASEIIVTSRSRVAPVVTGIFNSIAPRRRSFCCGEGVYPPRDASRPRPASGTLPLLFWAVGKGTLDLYLILLHSSAADPAPARSGPGLPS